MPPCDVAHGDPLGGKGENAEPNPWPKGVPPLLVPLDPPAPLDKLAKLGAERPRFHNPVDEGDGEDSDGLRCEEPG